MKNRGIGKKICQNCGTQSDDNALFSNQCVAQFVNQQLVYQPPIEQVEGKKKTALTPGIAVVIAVLDANTIVNNIRAVH